MNALNIDWAKFINRVLPTAIRKPILKAWVKVLLSPAIELFGLLTTARQKYIDDLSISVLTDILQAKLRVSYPNVTNFKVYVINQWDPLSFDYDQYIGEHHGQGYDYFLSEGAAQEYDYFLSEQSIPYDYNVYVPTAYSSDASAINQFLNRYKPAGKRFQIIFQNIV